MAPDSLELWKVLSVLFLLLPVGIGDRFLSYQASLSGCLPAAILAAECESLHFKLRKGGTGMGDVAKQEFWMFEGKNSLLLEQKSCHLF